MTRKAYFYFVLTFVGGVIAGSGGLYIALWRLGHIIPHRAPPDPQRIVDHISHDLNMTPDQKQKLTDIINDSFQKHHALDQQVADQYKALRVETREQIRKILNPDQQQKFDDMVRRFEQRRLQGTQGPPH